MAPPGWLWQTDWCMTCLVYNLPCAIVNRPHGAVWFVSGQVLYTLSLCLLYMAPFGVCVYVCVCVWCMDQVIFGENGVRDSISEGKGFVNLSTVDPETSSRMAEVRHMHAVTRYIGAAVL